MLPVRARNAERKTAGGAEPAYSGARSHSVALTDQAGGSQNTGSTAKAVPPVFSKTSLQELPEAPLSIGPLHTLDMAKVGHI